MHHPPHLHNRLLLLFNLFHLLLTLLHLLLHLLLVLNHNAPVRVHLAGVPSHVDPVQCLIHHEFVPDQPARGLRELVVAQVQVDEDLVHGQG